MNFGRSEDHLLKLQERWWLQHVVEEAALSVEYLSPACE